MNTIEELASPWSKSGAPEFVTQTILPLEGNAKLYYFAMYNHHTDFDNWIEGVYLRRLHWSEPTCLWLNTQHVEYDEYKRRAEHHVMSNKELLSFTQGILSRLIPKKPKLEEDE